MRHGIQKRLSGLFRRRSIFYQTLLSLIALSLVTAVFFGYMMSAVFGERQRRQIVELNLNQMRRASEDVELAFDLLFNGMVQNLWTADFLKVMIDPEGTELTHQSRVLSALKTYQDVNDLVEEACLYTPFSQLVYSSSGVSFPLEYAGSAPVIEAYLDRYVPGDGELDTDWRVLVLDGSVYLFAEMHTPVFVGLMFLRIHNENLLSIVQTGQENGLSLAVFDENGVMIAEEPEAGLEPEEPAPERTVSPDNPRYTRAKSYYQVESQRTGWHFYSLIDQELMTAGAQSILKAVVPAIAAYLLVSVLLSFYITRKVYQPIGHLMKLTLPEGAEPQGNEADFLELAYADSMNRNEQYQEMMRSVSQDVIRQQLRSILFGQGPEEGQLQEILDGIGASELLQGRWQAAALQLLPPEERNVNSVELALYQKSLIRLVQETDSGEIRVFPVMMDQRNLALVLWFSTETAVVKGKQYLNRLNQNLEARLRTLPFNVLLGKGKVYTSLDSLNASYQEALGEIHYQRYYEEPEAGESGGQDRNYLREKVHLMLQMAFDGKKEEAQAAAELMLREFLWKEWPEPERAGACALVMDEILEWLIEAGCPVEKLDRLRAIRDGGGKAPEDAAEPGEEDRPAEAGKETGPAEAGETPEPGGTQTEASPALRLRKGMEDFCREAVRLAGSGSRKNRYKYVEEAKSYIGAHYMDSNLSLNEISEYIGITASYLSSLFADVTGQNFSGYLNRFRVEQAKLLLRTTGRTVTEVGYKCGFNSVQSFSRTFKKVTGLTPNGYRESQKGQEV